MRLIYFQNTEIFCICDQRNMARDFGKLWGTGRACAADQGQARAPWLCETVEREAGFSEIMKRKGELAFNL